ncbi:MAG: hypothetical protein JSR93_11630 [Verrucomicrobia bacterium]|nr:hypothetical protein [Verrucomicrobiota bacterium]
MGEVSPKLRAAAVEEQDNVIILFFYFDGEISEEDAESAQCVGTEVIADFPEHKIDVRLERIDYPGLIPSIGELVYKRREP